MADSIRRLLIANRGEIACRIARTARRLGIETVGVYSDTDAAALHVRSVDRAVRIGPAAASRSYLDIQAIVAAARATCADAVHPGYGFLSQVPEFVYACAAAGLVFVGPPASAMRAMGAKHRAKALMQAAGVPTLPGYFGDDDSPDRLAAEAGRVGFPLLVKASAGGGGKGMRIVRTAGELPEALLAARGEALRAFGDGRLMLERFVERGRHVEVQVLADRYGSCVTLGTRDCTLQRRYQKILEEAPAAAIAPGLRRELEAAAVAAARAVDYANAGTVEFIVSDGGFFFLEMNTRLQVEHPVTEAVYSLDLVEWQLRVAAGERLPAEFAALEPRGHSLEVRLYAEDPRRDFLPTSGRARLWKMPGPPVRVDAALEAGDRIVTDYDSLAAKLVVHAASRDEALDLMEQALDQVRIGGVRSNLPALVAIARHPDVRWLRTHTRWLDETLPLLLASPEEARAVALAAATRATLSAVASCDAGAAIWADGEGRRWTCRFAGGGRFFEVHGADVRLENGIASVGDRRLSTWAELRHDHARCGVDGERFEFDLLAGSESAAAETADGLLRAPMPGIVLRVLVRPSLRVSAGEPLVVLEAMKMEHTLRASTESTVTALFVAEGDRVLDGAPLLQLSGTGA